MPAPTLLAIAQRNLIRNLPGLQDVGDIPYEAVAPALRKIVDPQQLRTIEIASPHIADADAELWLAFIKRDVLDWKKNLVYPKNPRSWWKVYRKMYREEKEAQEAQQRQLEEALAGKQKEKEQNQTTVLNTVVKQRFRQTAMVDGLINPNAGSYGNERVGTVANARKNGKSVISAIRKAASRPAHYKAPPKAESAASAQPKMWQTPIIPPGTRRKDPPNLLHMRKPPGIAERNATAAFESALKRDEKIREEKAKRASNSPPPLTAANLRMHENSPPKPTPSVPHHAAPPKTAAARDLQPSQQEKNASAATQPVTEKHTAALGLGAGSKRPISPEKASPAPAQKRPRPQTSIFMPSKRVKR